MKNIYYIAGVAFVLFLTAFYSYWSASKDFEASRLESVKARIALSYAQKAYYGEDSLELEILSIASRPDSDVCEGRSKEAAQIAEMVIAGQLVSPASADFAEPTVAEEGCTYSISGKVNSQNAFGAILTTKYQVGMEFSTSYGEWTKFDIWTN